MICLQVALYLTMYVFFGSFVGGIAEKLVGYEFFPSLRFKIVNLFIWGFMAICGYSVALFTLFVVGTTLAYGIVFLTFYGFCVGVFVSKAIKPVFREVNLVTE